MSRNAVYLNIAVLTLNSRLYLKSAGCGVIRDRGDESMGVASSDSGLSVGAETAKSEASCQSLRAFCPLGAGKAVAGSA